MFEDDFEEYFEDDEDDFCEYCGEYFEHCQCS